MVLKLLDNVFEASPGTHVSVAAEEALSLARSEARTIILIFNDRKLVISQYDNIEDIERKWSRGY